MTAFEYALALIGTLGVSFAVFMALIPFGLIIGRVGFTEIIERINWGM